MIRTVAKHSYVKGKTGLGKGRAHINYIAFRGGGEEVEKRGRRFFDNERDNIEASEIKQLLYERADEYGVTMHKIVLSPGMQEVDVKEFTREVMSLLAEEKKQELLWSAVVHNNTDHRHAHVVVMGLDRNGHRVRLDRHDHKWMRETGDEYLSREHKLERYLDREIEQLLKDRDYDRGGDEMFRKLMYGQEQERQRDDAPKGKRGKDKERDDDPERDRREFEKFDRDMKQAFRQREGRDLYQIRGQQRRLEQKGRLSEFHGHYAESMAEQRAKEISEKYPELTELMQKDLERLNEIAREDQISFKRDPGLDKLCGLSPSIERNRNEQESSRTFEADRQLRGEQDKGEDRERDRGDLEPGGG